MQLAKHLNTKICQLVLQLSIFLAVPVLCILSFVSDFNHPKSTQNYRAPANFAQDEELAESVSFENQIWLDQVMIDDKGKTLTHIQNNISNWERIDQIAYHWNLEDYTKYSTPDRNFRRSFVEKQLLKYLDKRLAGEIKEAEEGSTLAHIGSVQKALKPSTKVSLGANMKLRFRAQVLQGNGILLLENPYVDAQANFKVNGKLNIEIKKDLKDIGFRALIKFYAHTGRYIASVNQKISDTISAEIVSSQKHDELAFTEDGEQVAKIIYSKAF